MPAVASSKSHAEDELAAGKETYMPATTDSKLYTEDELHKVPQTSARLKCSERYVWNLIDAGELDVIRHGRAVTVTVP